jgi:hypothetical protein
MSGMTGMHYHTQLALGEMDSQKHFTAIGLEL